MRITGERVTTAHGGFNPTFQRHVAAYERANELLPTGSVVDLGCGIGHSFRALGPRRTVGVDVDPSALRGQDRETVVADMRLLPFADDTFAGALAVQSLEHVPEPERACAEAARVVEPGGTAIFVTPNRLTFGVRDEIVDPYHFIEFSPTELSDLCAAAFAEVRVLGLFGSQRYLEIVARERARLVRALSLDPLRLRRLLPRGARRRLYDVGLRSSRARARGAEAEITTADFELADRPIEAALDLIAVCRVP